MQKRRAILVNGSRLLREFVKRVIEKKAGFEVIRELEEIQDLPSAIVDTNAEWAIVTLSENQEIPESMKMELLRENPPLHIVGLWIEGNHVKIEWLVHEYKDMTELTLDELTHLIRRELDVIQKEGSGSGDGNG